MKMLNKKFAFSMLLGAILAPMTILVLAGCSKAADDAGVGPKDVVVTPPADNAQGKMVKERAKGQ